jgi:hypothetical protein
MDVEGNMRIKIIRRATFIEHSPGHIVSPETHLTGHRTTTKNNEITRAPLGGALYARKYLIFLQRMKDL